MSYGIEIVEDCYPYYVIFKFPGLEEIVKICQEYKLWSPNKWQHFILPETIGQRIESLIPFSKEMDLSLPYRATIFATAPGFRNPVHKDNWDVRFSFNIGFSILDSNCITRWYPDDVEERNEVQIYQNGVKVRVMPDFNYEGEPWTKQMTLKQGEAIIVNTELWHNWDNSDSKNQRSVLTIRARAPSEYYFDEARDRLLKLSSSQ